jgi:hypothetical protein
MLTLVGIDPEELLFWYLKRTFNVAIPTKKVKATTSKIVYDMETGSDPRACDVYRHLDNNNNMVRVVTKDHGIFQSRQDEISQLGISIHNAEGESFSYLPSGGSCKWCRRKCEATPTLPTLESPNNFYPIGLPITMKYEEQTNRIRFDTIGYFCCFGCAFSYLKTKFPVGRLTLHPYLGESEHLLRILLKIVAGEDAVLKECHDWDLLDINGGPMDANHYFAGQTVYMPLNNVIMLPSKEMYSER